MRMSRWKLFLYSLIILGGLVLALPNLFSQEQLDKMPSWFPKKQVALGLDLRGGSHLVLEVDSSALLTERMENMLGDARRELRDANIPLRTLRLNNNTLNVVLRDPAQQDAAVTALQRLGTSVSVMSFGGAANSDIAVTREGNDRLNVAMTEAGIRDRVTAAVEQSLEIIRRRIDQVGVAEPTIQRVGSDRILVQLPGVQDPARVRELLGSTAKLSFHMVADSVGNAVLPPGVSMLPGTQEGETYPVYDTVALTGEHLTDARAGFDQQTREPIVSFRFDTTGARIFAQITRDNTNRPFAIVLDGKVLSAPVIREPITGGSGQISGNFTVQQASDLSALLRAGALPAPLQVIEERTVGADLGADAIKRGIESGLWGFVLVFAFMLVLYGRWGLIANFALFLNVLLTFGALTLLGATLTLPGIAGIVLGIGLAVDANVLINERIREETRKGLGAVAALNAGFDRAFATIMDSNVTALIATLLLFAFGSGPVKGFAITMALGIGISMFTAVSVVRVIMTLIVRGRKLKQLVIEPIFGIKFIKDNTSIRFMRGRYVGLAVSLVLSAASVVLFFNPGLNYGVDFKGGIQMEVRTQGAADLAGLRTGLESLNMGEIALQEFGSDNNVLIRAERQEGGEAAQREAVERLQAKLQEISPGSTIERTEVVGPKVSGELAVAGLLSVFFASIAMLIYIWVRFEWPFAVGAIVTLVLDITKTIGFFAITGLDFNLTAIAAILTLVGYSVNDKVVVYDRMRENMRIYKQMPLRELIDKSINETLARSLYTSITALLAMLPMAIWGGSAVESFAVPMVFGIIIAASSSVFIAAPILLFLGDWRKRRKENTEGEGKHVLS